MPSATPVDQDIYNNSKEHSDIQMKINTIINSGNSINNGNKWDFIFSIPLLKEGFFGCHNNPYNICILKYKPQYICSTCKERACGVIENGTIISCCFNSFVIELEKYMKDKNCSSCNQNHAQTTFNNMWENIMTEISRIINMRGFYLGPTGYRKDYVSPKTSDKKVSDSKTTEKQYNLDKVKNGETINTDTQPVKHINITNSCKTMIAGELKVNIESDEKHGECSICLDDKIDTTRKRIFGPCGHDHVCDMCLHNLIKHTKQEDYMSCPKCRQDVVMIITHFST